MQKYVSEPSKDCDGTYVVSRWDEIKNDYIPLDREICIKGSNRCYCSHFK